MNPTTEPVRVLAFASPAHDLWGGLVTAASGAALVLGAGDAREAAGPGAVSLEIAGDTWSVAGGDTALTVTPEPGDPAADPASDDAPASGPAPALGRPAQACQVRGHVTAGGETIQVSCPGLRFEVARGDAGSLRAVAGWFGPELALTLGALRAPRSRGHEHDRMTATLWESGRPRVVDEPRLSTTLRDDGLPARMSMELWVAEGDDLYPRRAAGEAGAPGARSPYGTPQLGCVPMTCHMAGRDGSGVYLLAQLA